MPKKFGVNIVAFGHIKMLLNSFDQGWDLEEIDRSLSGSNIGVMLLPVRGISRRGYIPQVEVLAFENAWNSAEFIPAVIKSFKDLKYSFKGSPSSQPGASALDRVSGMNYEGEGTGTIVDWLLFGNLPQSFMEYSWLIRKFRGAVESVHTLRGVDSTTVVELHPEFRREVCEIHGIDHNQFLVWLSEQSFNVCVDTFHTFQRGSRDGLEPNPFVPPEYREWFIKVMGGRIKEVHFRLSKAEEKLILKGESKNLPLYSEMRQLFTSEDCIFILELYPNLLSDSQKVGNKVRTLWWELYNQLS